MEALKRRIAGQSIVVIGPTLIIVGLAVIALMVLVFGLGSQPKTFNTLNALDCPPGSDIHFVRNDSPFFDAIAVNGSGQSLTEIADRPDFVEFTCNEAEANKAVDDRTTGLIGRDVLLTLATLLSAAVIIYGTVVILISTIARQRKPKPKP